MIKRPEKITFNAEGLKLAGHLFLPEGKARKWPAVVMPGALPSVKEQVADRYATLLADRGFAVLTFDYRNYGESEGVPRESVDSMGRVADVSAAISFLRTRPEIDHERLGTVAICTGTGYALRAAAFDRRIKVYVGVAGCYPSPYMWQESMGAEGYQAALASAMEAVERRDQTGEIEYLPAYQTDPAQRLTREAQEMYEFYGTDRGKAENFRPHIERASMHDVLTVDTTIGADFISPTPVLMVHGDGDFEPMSPAQTQAVYDRISEPKKLVWIHTKGHIDLYDNEKCMGEAVAAITDFLKEYL